jgi:hypothetical protein
MKKVVYSCLFSSGTKRMDHPNINETDKLEGFDYIMFTNISDKLQNTVCTFIDKDLMNEHPIHTAKYYKWNSHKYFEDYEIAIYVDAYMMPNPTIKWDEYIPQLKSDDINCGIIQMKHSQRNCIYMECNAIVGCKKDTRINMDKVINFLKTNNMPGNYGLFECGLFLRHLKNEELNSI